MVLADGWKLRLVDPYGQSPKLYVRRPGTSEETRTVFADVSQVEPSGVTRNSWQDDPYYTELSTIIDVVEGKLDKSAILSPYHDAMQTYNFVSASGELYTEGKVSARSARAHVADLADSPGRRRSREEAGRASVIAATMALRSFVVSCSRQMRCNHACTRAGLLTERTSMHAHGTLRVHLRGKSVLSVLRCERRCAVEGRISASCRTILGLAPPLLTPNRFFSSPLVPNPDTKTSLRDRP